MYYILRLQKISEWVKEVSFQKIYLEGCPHACLVLYGDPSVRVDLQFADFYQLIAYKMYIWYYSWPLHGILLLWPC